MPDDPETTEDLEAVTERLYGLHPDDFVPERDAAVASARERGDRDLAKAIGRLRRPTRAAWLANLLARQRPEQLEGLLGLAAGLADAQRTLDGAALRQLSSRRHQLVAAMAREAGRLAGESGDSAGESVLRDLQGILEAALARPDLADEVRSGRLTRTISYSGFGPPAEPGAAPAPAPVRRPATAPPADRDGERSDGEQRDDDERAERERAERQRLERERERERREEALAAAEAEEAAAFDRQQAAETARDEAVAARDAAKELVAELTAELEAARERERAATTAAREAEAAAKAEARAAGAAASKAARARARLDELG